MALTANLNVDSKLEECISNCIECHAICERTIQHCLQIGGEHASPVHIRTLKDCAQICMTSADFMIRESPMHGSVCGVCASACERCAEECERLGDDEMMQNCAETCRRCAESCRRMAGANAM